MSDGGSVPGNVPSSGPMPPTPVQRILVLLIRVYQSGVSPFLPSACRFLPTCSEYMRQAIEHHGAVQGGVLGVKRLCRCHPFHPGGVDPVPHA